jgi:hypothetical protein
MFVLNLTIAEGADVENRSLKRRNCLQSRSIHATLEVELQDVLLGLVRNIREVDNG